MKTVKQQMYVIATRGQHGKEVYLKCSDRECKRWKDINGMDGRH